jgi:hypothetical protein
MCNLVCDKCRLLAFVLGDLGAHGAELLVEDGARTYESNTSTGH